MKKISVDYLYLLVPRIQDVQRAGASLGFSPAAALVYFGQAVPFADDGHELVSCLMAHYCLSKSRAGGRYI